MSLKIETKDGCYDLPPDFKAEFELTNPFFTDKGSQTVATNLPLTNNNRQLTGFPDRIDRANKIKQKERVILSSGPFVRAGIQNINGADKGGINISFGMDEGEMYAKMSKMKLNELPDLPCIDFQSVWHLVLHLNSVMKEQTAADYEIFPIVVSSDLHEASNNQYIEWVNEVNSNDKNLFGFVPRQKDFLISGDVVPIKLPVGYGVSPFLKVSTILRLIYASFGYELKESAFNTHFQLKKLVVLNNAVDAIVKGKIDYKQLMPDATISDFLTMLWVRFGVKIFVDSNTRTAKVCFIKDCITNQPNEDWSRFKDEFPKQNFTAYKQLKLSASKSIEGAETECDTYREFLEKYNFIVCETISFSGISNNIFLRYNRNTGQYLVMPINSASPERKFVSSSFFDWDQKNELEYEELTSSDECVPMIYQDGTPNLNFPAFLVGANHFNTMLKRTGTKEEEKNNTAKLALCYKLGELQFSQQQWSGFFGGSVFCKDLFNDRNYIDKQGNEFRYSLTFHDEFGAFKQFHAKYDALLRHALQPVEVKLNLDKIKLSSLDLSKQKIIDNQPYLIENIKFSIGENPDKTTANLKTTRLQKPYDLEKEQSIPTTQKQIYYWKFMSNEDDKIYESVANIVGPNEWIEIYNRTYEIAPENDEVPALPPNQSDVDNNTKLNLQNCRVYATIFIRYGHGSDQYMLYYRTVDFQVWFEPALL